MMLLMIAELDGHSALPAAIWLNAVIMSFKYIGTSMGAIKDRLACSAPAGAEYL